MSPGNRTPSPAEQATLHGLRRRALGACDVLGDSRRAEVEIKNLGSTGKKDDDAMDVGAFCKGKPKGKGKGKFIGAFSKGKAKAIPRVKAKEERKVMERVATRPRADQVRQPRLASTAGSREISKRIANWPRAKEKANNPKVARKA